MTDPRPAPKPEAPAASKASSTSLDIATCGGLILALGGIVGGLALEGGSIREILQPNAALIVFGGTLGAVMVTTPLGALKRAVRAMVSVFVERKQTASAIIEEVIGYATKARKNGIVSLEQDTPNVEDPFLRKALNLAVDGTDLQEIRKMMELEMSLDEQHGETAARVLEAAGGYSPTIGIIGAVLGLIQVMKNLANIDEVGRGIATAFVATIYGVAAANVFFLPAGGKIRARSQAGLQLKELMLEGVSGIVEGLNPKLIRTKLEAYLEAPPERPKRKATGAKDAAKGAPEAARSQA